MLIEIQAIEESNLPEQTKQTLLAIWLANQPEGKWELEAYQHVAEIKEYEPAALVQQGLKMGLKP